MKLSRRGLFGVFAGAAVAGPSVARNALDGGLGGMPVPPMVPYVGGSAGIPDEAGSSAGWQAERNARLMGHIDRLRNRPHEASEFHRLRMQVNALDCDLQSYRSFSLAAKVRIQRDRNYERELQDDIARWTGRLLGWLD